MPAAANPTARQMAAYSRRPVFIFSPRQHRQSCPHGGGKGAVRFCEPKAYAARRRQSPAGSGRDTRFSFHADRLEYAGAGRQMNLGSPGRESMKRIAKACCIAAAVSFFAVPAFAQHGHHHHDNAAQQKDVKMTVHQVASDALEIRLGPYDLPAHTGHDEMPQAPEFFWDVPFDGWLVSYAPSLIDGDGNDIPPKLLHHVAFYNTGRSDFLCPNKEEHVFGSGGELNRWPPLPGFGYPVHRGDRIRISTMFHNPTGTSYHAFLSVQVNYVSSELVQSGIPQLRSVYPAWFDVMQCGESGYDLKSGESVKSGQFQMQQAGLLLGLGG